MHRYRTLLATLGGLFESEYQAVLDRATALGYTLPSESQNISNNNKVKYLKAEGIWSGLSVLWYNKQESGLEDFATLNWVNPTQFQLNQTNSSLKPTFVPDNGFRATSGTGKYFNTGWIPNSNLSITNIGVFWKAFDIPSTFATATSICGCRGPLLAVDRGQILIQDNSQTQTLFRLGLYPTQNTLQTSENRHRFMARGVSNTYVVYENGSVLQTINADAPNALPSLQLTYLGFNNNGSILGTNSGAGVSYLAFGTQTSLSGKQVEIYEIMEELYIP